MTRLSGGFSWPDTIDLASAESVAWGGVAAMTNALDGMTLTGALSSRLFCRWQAFESWASFAAT